MRVILFGRTSLLLAGLLVVVCADSVCAVNTSWTDGTGSWFNPGNWSAGVPTPAVDAYVDLWVAWPEIPPPPPYSVMVQVPNVGGAPAEAHNVYLGYTFGGNEFSRYVGRMEITGGGGLSCWALTLGYNVYSYGYARISGSGSAASCLKNPNGVTIGNYGEGEVLVENYGHLEAPGTGISLGYEYVTSGLGWPASKGTLTVTSGGSVSTNHISVGNFGQGFLTVSAGGTLVSSSGANIGWGPRSAGSKATVTGANSTWSSGWIGVGTYQGSGTLEVKLGGRVNASSLDIGDADEGTTGTVTISDSTSRIELSSNIMISKGSLTINNGLLTATGLDMNTAGSATLNGGTFDVGGNIDAINGNMYLYGGTLRTNRFWAGSGTMDNNGATVDPKNYLLEVLYDSSHPGEYRYYRQWSGSLWIDVDGNPASGLFDRMRAKGVTFSGGNLKLDFTYVPAAGTTYQFLIADTITGSCLFSTSGLPAGYSVQVNFPAGTFTVIPEPSTLALLGAGAAALLALAWRRRK